MTFPIAFLLLPYTILLILIAVVGGVNVYHVAKFGTFDVRNRMVVSAFLFYSLAVIVLAALYFLGIDWAVPVTLSAPVDVQIPSL